MTDRGRSRQITLRFSSAKLAPAAKQKKQISPPGEILLLLRFDTLTSRAASHLCTA
jgi:hypothetical protein